MTSPAPRGRSPIATAGLVLAGALTLAALLWLQHSSGHGNHAAPSSTPTVTLNMPTGTPVPVTSGPTTHQATHPSSAPVPYQPSALRQAQQVARKFLIAYHSSSYTDMRPTAQPDAAKPYMTAAMHARMIARLPRPGQQSASDRQYVQQAQAEQRVVHTSVTSLGIASGDGDHLPKNQIPLVAYFHTVTYTLTDSSGVFSSEQTSHLTLVLQQGHWLVATADGI